MTEPIVAQAPMVVPIAVQPLPFFRRILALVIDVLALGFAGQLAALFLSSQFAALGPWGRLAGGAVCVLYYGIGNSRLTGGRTVGKWLMNIAVRHVSGAPLSIPASLGRAVVMMLPVVMNGAAFLGTSTAAQIIGGLVMFGLGGVTLYLFLFTRRPIHDLAVRSVVVQTRVPQPAEFPPVPLKHFVIAIVILAVAAGAFMLFFYSLSDAFDFPALLTAQRHVIEATGSPSVQVTQQKMIVGGGSARWLVVAVHTYSAAESEEAEERLANEIAGIVMRDVPDAATQSKIVVSITHGYDILIASGWRSTTWSHAPDEWRERIDG